jgi:hypothetical protein
MDSDEVSDEDDELRFCSRAVLGKAGRFFVASFLGLDPSNED